MAENDERTKKISREEKQKIIFYHQNNKSIAFIAEKLNRHTVSKWIRRYIEFGINGINGNNGTGTENIRTISQTSEQKITKATGFFRKYNVQSINFSQYGPDFNPMENIWAILKRNVMKRRSEITAATFENIIIEEWNKISRATIINTINSMTERIKLVIKNKGDYVEY